MRIVIVGTENQNGTKVPYESVIVEGKKYFLEKLNCLSAISFGLGTCRCGSHPTYIAKEISFAKAKEMVSFLLKGEIAVRERRLTAIAQTREGGGLPLMSKEDSSFFLDREKKKNENELEILRSFF